MSTSQRISAVVGYLPVVGWLYVALFQRGNALARFHLRQSVGVCLYMILAFVAWLVAAWISAWVPYLTIIGISLFTLVIATWVVGAIGWVIGLVRAARGEMSGVPLFEGWSNRLPL